MLEENVEDTKPEDSFDCSLGSEIDELLKVIHSGSIKKDPFFNDTAWKDTSGSSELLEDHLFWEYEDLEEQFDQQAI